MRFIGIIIEIVNRLTLSITALSVGLCLLGGCKRDIQNTDAVRKGVLAYFAKRSDLLSMEVSVTNVVYHDNQATATVHLQAKGSNTPGSGMDMRYLMERQGNEWVVKGRAGGETHGEGTATPPASDGGSIGAMPQTLPPGHPATPTLPPGHPAVSPDKQPGKQK